LQASRRKFLSLLGVSTAAGPLAAKAAADTEIAKLAGISQAIANTGLGMYGRSPGQPISNGQSGAMSYAQMAVGASDYIKVFGVPEVIEFELRDQSKWISALDPDLASKKSWSMSVKILEQRERNYKRAVERLEKAGWQQKKRSAIKALLGFEWPW
jgi:hypothetical protein